MDLLYPSEAPTDEESTVFREGRLGAPFFATILLIATMVAVVTGLKPETPAAFWFIPLGLGVVCVASFSLWRTAVDPTNWILKQTPAALYLKFRSHRLECDPYTSLTVLRVESEEIATVCRTRVTRPGPGNQMQSFHYIDLELNDDVSAEVRNALAREMHERPEPVGLERLRDHVRLAQLVGSNILRITWRCDDLWIRPGARLALRFLARTLPAHEANGLVTPIAADLSDGEFERYLLDLAARGQEEEASRELRRRRGLALDEAREHVDALLVDQCTRV